MAGYSRLSQRRTAAGSCSWARRIGFCAVKPQRARYLPTVRTASSTPQRRAISAPRRPAPERERQAQLVRGVTADQLPHLRLLVRAQEALLVRLAAPRLAHQPLRALGREALADVDHPGPAQSDLPGDLPVGQAAPAQADH